jgi:hypothetical protein
MFDITSSVRLVGSVRIFSTPFSMHQNVAFEYSLPMACSLASEKPFLMPCWYADSDVTNMQWENSKIHHDSPDAVA